MNSFKLKLFGGAVLEGEGGIVRGRAAHRRRLALLALLAVGRGRTVARERLIGYLWPESDGESARHLLSESLYVLRKVLGENVFISAGDEVGVDPAMLSTDLAAFEDAVACGALERAVEVYAGPFLDGFYVADAPDFERWAETERDRLARAYARALETLAAAREADGRWTEAVEWARRLFAHDPFNSRTTLRLMTALDAAGERGAALKVAAAHTTLMRDELQAEPEPAVLGLAERLRAEPAPVPELPSRPAGHLLRLATAAGEGVGVEGAEPALAVATANPATDVAPSTPPTPRRSARAASLRPGWRMAAAGLAIAVAAAAWTLTARDPAATGVSVAVFPLESAAGVPPTVDPAELRRLFSNAFTLVPGL